MSSHTQISDREEKLPLKSINGRRCLSKCYPKGATYLHPIFLTGITNQVTSYCAIDPVYSKDPQYQGMILADVCRMEDNNIYQTPDELESLLLNFYFNPYDFLTNIYGLYSFDDVIYWTLDNDHLPFDTIKRVHNCAWRVFGGKLEELSTNVLEYYYDISKTYWLKDYTKYIQNNYSFDLVTKDKTADDAFKEIYEILSTKFYTYEFFVNTVKRYIHEHRDKWDHIHSHYGNLKKYILDRLVEQLNKMTDVGKK